MHGIMQHVQLLRPRGLKQLLQFILLVHVGDLGPCLSIKSSHRPHYMSMSMCLHVQIYLAANERSGSVRKKRAFMHTSRRSVAAVVCKQDSGAPKVNAACVHALLQHLASAHMQRNTLE